MSATFILYDIHGMTPKRRGHMASHIGRRKFLATLVFYTPACERQVQLVNKAIVGRNTADNVLGANPALDVGPRLTVLCGFRGLLHRHRRDWAPEVKHCFP